MKIKAERFCSKVASLVCAAALVLTAIPFGLAVGAAPNLTPKVYTNSFEEPQLSTVYSNLKNANNYSLVKDGNNTVMRYIGRKGATDTYNNSLRFAFYDPASLDSGTWAYPWSLKAGENKDYKGIFKISFRYKVRSFESDCSSFSIMLSTANSQNAYNNLVNHTNLVTVSQVGDWQQVTAIAQVNGNFNWQSSSLGLTLYDCRGEVWIDDVVIEDYTETDVLYAIYNTDGGKDIKPTLVKASEDIPKAERGNEKFLGWYLDGRFENEFDFNTYDRAALGPTVQLYAKFEKSVAGSVTYNDNFDTQTAKSFYNQGGTKFLAFSLAEIDGNTALKYQMKRGDDFDYAANYCNLYNNINGGRLSNGDRKALYRVSLRYRVDSLADDCGSMSISLSSLNSENCWGTGNTSSASLVSSGLTDGEWKTAESFVIINTKGFVWNQYALGLAVSGRGVMYIDDVVIQDCTNTDLLYMTFNTGGGTDIPTTIIQSKEEMPADPVLIGDEFAGWYLDSDFNTPFDFDTYNRETDGFEIQLFAKYKGSVKGEIVYKNDYESDIAKNFYAQGGTKFLSFSLAELDGNTALKYQMKRGDQYDYAANYCTIYNNVVGGRLGNGNRKALYRVSFRYRVDSLAEDCGGMNISLSNLNSENCWGSATYRSSNLLTSGVTNGKWKTADRYVMLDTKGLVWNNYALGLAVSGRGVMYIDDVIIKDCTDTDLLYITFNTNGGKDIAPKVINSNTDSLPTPEKTNDKFMGWYLDSNFENEFDLSTYDRANNGFEISLFARFKNSLAGSVTYTNTFDEDYVSGIYTGGTHYLSFGLEELDGDRVIKYKMNKEDGYSYSVNYFALYNNIERNRLKTGQHKSLYKVSFKYKVESLADDCGAMGILLSTMHSEICWGEGPFVSETIAAVGRTYGKWETAEKYVMLDTTEAPSNKLSLGIAVSGRGLMYIDDIVIEDLTDTTALYCRFDTYGGKEMSDVVINSNEELPTPVRGEDVFVGWYTDKLLQNKFDFKTYNRSEKGILTKLYARYENSGMVIIDPNKYDNSFEDTALINELYDGKNKENAFSFYFLGSEGSVLKYSSTDAEKVNHFLLYDNLNRKILTNGKGKRIYKISFKYKANSLDGDVTIGVGTANSELSEKSVVKQVVKVTSAMTDWQTAEISLLIDTTNLKNANCISLTAQGKGEVLFDDIVIKDYTDTNALLIEFETGEGSSLEPLIAESRFDIPVSTKVAAVFNGWFSNKAKTSIFEFEEYDRKKNGMCVKLYADFSDFISITPPTLYKNTFEEEYVPKLYPVREKYNSFSFATVSGGNTALKYSLSGADDYGYGSNYCLLYNNNEEKLLTNEGRMSYFRVSFRYRVDSLEDGGYISVGLSQEHTGNIWVTENNYTTPIMQSGVTDGWKHCEQWVELDTSSGDWQLKGIGLVLYGRGVMYIDDIIIEDYTNTGLTGYFLVSNGGTSVAPFIGNIGDSFELPTNLKKSAANFLNWCNDRTLKQDISKSTVTIKKEGLTLIYAKWLEETIEYPKFTPPEETKEKYTFNAIYKGSHIGSSQEESQNTDNPADEQPSQGGGNPTDEEFSDNNYYPTDDQFSENDDDYYENDLNDSEDEAEDGEQNGETVLVRRKKKVMVMPGEGNNLPLIIGTIVAAVITVCGVAIAIILFRRKRRAAK